MRYKDRMLIKEYAKSIGMNFEVCKRVFLRGDQKQQAIDIVGMEATLWLKDKKEKGELKANKKGKVSIKLTDKLIQKFIKEKYGGLENMPEFFRNPLPIMEENKLFSKPKNKIRKKDMVIEESAPEYINEKK